MITIRHARPRQTGKHHGNSGLKIRNYFSTLKSDSILMLIPTVLPTQSGRAIVQSHSPTRRDAIATTCFLYCVVNTVFAQLVEFVIYKLVKCCLSVCLGVNQVAQIVPLHASNLYRWDEYSATTRFRPGIALPVITRTRPGITLKYGRIRVSCPDFCDS